MKFKNSQLKKLMIIINEYWNTPILTTLICQSLIMKGCMHSVCSYILVYFNLLWLASYRLVLIL